MRLRAILYALYYGILPYWCYEEKCHYECSYLRHLIINLQIVARWITWREDAIDIEFERRINKQS